MNERLQKLVSKGMHMRATMWRASHDETTRLENWAYALMRVGAITWAGLKENRILNRAAALSFTSILALGPVIALMVMVSGFVLDKTQPDRARNMIEEAIQFMVPQIELDAESPSDGESASQSELSNLIQSFIESSQSGAIGIGAIVALFLIVIQLFTAIEDAFNDIWGVQRGRNIVTRVILYWTIITLGAILAFAGVAILVSQALKLTSQLSAMAQILPGDAFSQWISLYGMRIAGFAIMTLILTLFYRFIPNTQVNWKAGLSAALFTIFCFYINNTLAFLYVERIAMQRTLYGSLALLLVLMIGFYTFWFCLLLGGRVSFAVQNAHFKGGKIAWDSFSPAAQESLSLMLYAQICRRFRSCGPAPSSAELSEEFNIPTQLASAALDRLCHIGLASRLPPENNDPFQAFRYQPSKPLDKIPLLDIKLAFENFGEARDQGQFDQQDTVVQRYHKLTSQAREEAFASQTMESLLHELDDPKTAR